MNCMNCGKQLTKRQEQKTKINKRIKWYCSYKCHGEAMEGIPLPEEHCKNISESKKGIPSWNKGLTKETDERVAKMSKAFVKRMVDNKTYPNFNKTSIQYFDMLNKAIFKDGLYAPNEFCIPELGYWLDFISHNKKIIIEYDEVKHKYKTKKDAIRQNKIQLHYPDYAFIRIKEKDAKINILAMVFKIN